MPSLFNESDAKAILERLENLTPQHQRKWGKMSIDQMLAHLSATMDIAVNAPSSKINLINFLFGRWAKAMVVSPKPYNNSLPTSKQLIITESKNFEEEKQKLILLIHQFIQNGPSAVDGKRHSFFGKMSAEEWSYAQWKHIDHHLTQFSA